uniref:Lactosylceramide 4-alpha-galactosyltransferase-like isoform X2 n=2 Tax=Diabrotica virgifera virgifera TaxID=50390 RepID=A0A6P7G2T5_DIAVI
MQQVTILDKRKMNFYSMRRRVVKIAILTAAVTTATCLITSLVLLTDKHNIFQKREIREQEQSTKPTLRNSIQCYRSKIESIPDISDSHPRKDKSIFFHESSCKSYYNNKIFINARQACAVESAATLNPNLDIYLLYSSPGIFKYDGHESDDLLEAILSYENVHVMHVDFERYIEGTPLESLYKHGKIEQSSYAISHASDILRFLSLWKYGGIYLDLDTISIKTLEGLPLNFAGLETNVSVNSAILSFNSSDYGHVLAEKCIMDLKRNFNGRLWANNGPGVITRLIRSICGVEKRQAIQANTCHGFRLFSESAFYPISGPSWEMYFNETYLNEVLEQTSSSYVLHIWNNNSANRKLPVDSKAPYLYFAKKYCPKVIEVCTDFF